MGSGSKRNIQLDVLRGVAILLVMGRHLELPRPGGIVGWFGELWFTIGWLGVDLFFVLSGFLIGGLLVAEFGKHGRIDIARFLVRRGLKIYPAYFVFIAYLIAMPMAKCLASGRDVWITFSEQWGMYWPNLLFLQNYVGTNPAGHTWTLAVEEHFYLLLPFMLAAVTAVGRMRRLVPLCVIIALLCLGLRCVSVLTADQFAAEMSATHLRLDALMFGVGIRALAEYFPQRFMAARQWRPLLVGAGIMGWSLNVFIEPSTTFIRTIGLSATYLGGACFLLAAFHTHAGDFGRWKRFLSPVVSMVAWLGMYSYGIYLWHVTAMGILEREIGGRILAATGNMTQVAWVASAFLVVVGALGCGIVASKIVEWPVLRLRDQLFPSRSGTLPAVQEKNPNNRGKQESHGILLNEVLSAKADNSSPCGVGGRGPRCSSSRADYMETV